MADIAGALIQFYSTSLYFSSNRPWFGDTLELTFTRPRVNSGNPGRLMLRNTQGTMVPLRKVCSVEDSEKPAYIDRFDMQPIAEISANPAAGATLAAIRTRCEQLAAECRAKQSLGSEYKLIWLCDLPAR